MSQLDALGSAAPLNALALVGGLALGAVVVLVLAAVARRLLGVHVGTIRMFVAGVVGYTVAALVSTTMDRGTAPLVLLSVLVGISLLVIPYMVYAVRTERRA
jgi:hypothetical protein